VTTDLQSGSTKRPSLAREQLSPRLRFDVPAGSDVAVPAERRGLARDAVRLLVARPAGVSHTTFRDLADHLEPGDVLVVNTSATLPAAVDAQRSADVQPASSPLHVATRLDDGSWVVEVRKPDNTGPADDVRPGELLDVTGGVRLRVDAAYPVPGVEGSRLWRATPSTTTSMHSYLADHGRPIRYGHVIHAWPLTDLQNVYADHPGSAEMASAGRPFTARLLVRLMARGVIVVPLTLHAGVSSPEKHEPPAPERYDVPTSTAEVVTAARRQGRRVVAVGTTVTRALESAADEDGAVRTRHGWTDLVLGPARPARAVTGLISGLHEPEASHLLLLEAVAGRALVEDAYAAAVAERYLWHEFGDSMLFLP